MIRLSILPTYYVPKDGPLHTYHEYVSLLPTVDHPEAFGQHPNADIASQIQETRMLFDTLLSLVPQVSSTGGDSREEQVRNNIQEQRDVMLVRCILCKVELCYILFHFQYIVKHYIQVQRTIINGLKYLKSTNSWYLKL